MKLALFFLFIGAIKAGHILMREGFVCDDSEYVFWPAETAAVCEAKVALHPRCKGGNGYFYLATSGTHQGTCRCCTTSNALIDGSTPAGDTSYSLYKIKTTYKEVV